MLAVTYDCALRREELVSLQTQGRRPAGWLRRNASVIASSGWRSLSTTALARAVVANAPAAEVPGTPTGDRPFVAADCGVDAANAVADRLRRADVVRINVIGGCHYVAVETTMDGNGFINATPGRQIATQRPKWRTAVASWVSL
jgi:hypothetical protein